jgi:hypothetical protein
MSEPQIATTDEVAALEALANGIIPADARDAGAAAVHAGQRLSERLGGGTSAAIYRRGLLAASDLAQTTFRKRVPALDAAELHDLLAALRAADPGFFLQLRLDVCALYLSDPEVWRRIGFPGPSTAEGGYPDFDMPQGRLSF